MLLPFIYSRYTYVHVGYETFEPVKLSLQTIYVVCVPCDVYKYCDISSV